MVRGIERKASTKLKVVATNKYLLVMVERGGSDELVLGPGHPLPAASAGEARVRVFSGRGNRAVPFRLAETNHTKYK